MTTHRTRNHRPAIEVPLLLVLLGIGATVVVALTEGFRMAGFVLAGILVAVALLRALPVSWSVAYGVRSRPVDVVTLLAFAGAIAFLAVSVPGS